jgi:hypothetical protein
MHCGYYCFPLASIWTNTSTEITVFPSTVVCETGLFPKMRKCTKRSDTGTVFSNSENKFNVSIYWHYSWKIGKNLPESYSTPRLVEIWRTDGHIFYSQQQRITYYCEYFYVRIGFGHFFVWSPTNWSNRILGTPSRAHRTYSTTMGWLNFDRTFIFRQEIGMK